MMKNKFVLIRYVFMLWMLCGASFTLSVAYAYDRSATPGGWGYQPFQSAPVSTNTPLYNCSVFGASKPAYQFRTTSAYITPSDMGTHRFTVEYGRVKRTGEWGNPDDEDNENLPISVVPVTPIGEPLVLLLFAVLFVFVQNYHKRLEIEHK